MRARRSTVGFVLGVLLPASLDGGIIPGHWEKVDSLESLTPITVHTTAGHRIKWTLVSSTETSLALTAHSQQTLLLPKADIEKVTLAEKTKDDNADGLAVGALKGFGVGFVGGVALAHDSRGASAGEQATAGLLVGGLGAGIVAVG